MVQLAVAAVGLGISLWQSARAQEAANEAQLRDKFAVAAIQAKQAGIDDATRRAFSRSIMAEVTSQNAQVQDLTRMQDAMKLQGKADAMMRKEGYNDVAAMQMVMGAASGRLTSEGSMSAIMDKSQEDYKWDQMWAMNSETIALASIERDKVNIYAAGLNKLTGAQDQLSLMKQGADLGRENTIMGMEKQWAANTLQQEMAFDNMLASTAQSYLRNFGASGTAKLGDTTKKTLIGG